MRDRRERDRRGRDWGREGQEGEGQKGEGWEEFLDYLPIDNSMYLYVWISM